MSLNFRGVSALGILLVFASVGRCDDELSDLLRRLPETANTVVTINVKSIRQASKWSEGYAFVGGTIIPPAVDLVVYATHLEPGAASSRKTMGLVKLNRDITLEDLAEKIGGRMVDLGDESVVLHPRKGYYVLLTPKLVGIGREITRPELIRGIKFARSSDKCLVCQFLTSTITTAGDAPIVGALDLENSLELATVRQRLAASQILEGRSKEELDAVAAFVAGLKGISLTVRGDGLHQAEIKLEFSKAVGEHGRLVKSLFLEALDDLRASMSDFEKFSVSTDGQTVKLQGKLSDDGLIQIMSLFMPQAPDPPSKAAAAPKLESNGVSLDITARYYKSVDQMLNHLRRMAKSDNTTYSRTATWHNTYADRIENMSTQYVDPSVVKFANSSAARLRTIALSLEGVVVQTNALESGMSLSGLAIASGSIFGSGSSMQLDSNISQTRSKQAEIIRQDAEHRLQIWNSIDTGQRNLLKEFRERYGRRLDTP